MNDLTPLVVAVLLVIGLVLIAVAAARRRNLGTLAGTILYRDTEEQPGAILYAENIGIMGKPDYLIRGNGTIVPVEVKTGKTPERPYKNHLMQLIAYCILVEANYPVRPTGGFIRYPEHEFWIDYTTSRKQELLGTISDMRHVLRTGAVPSCHHPEHN